MKAPIVLLAVHAHLRVDDEEGSNLLGHVLRADTVPYHGAVKAQNHTGAAAPAGLPARSVLTNGQDAEAARDIRESGDWGYTVCLTSTPWRIGSIGPVVDSLLAQRPAPSSIVVSVPRTLEREGEAAVHLRDEDLAWSLQPEYASVRLVRLDEDHGPASKLIDCLPHADARASCLIVTDDDAPRPSWWASLFLASRSCTGREGVSGGVTSRGDPSMHVQGNRGFALAAGAVGHAELLAFYAAHRGACEPVDDQLFTSFFRRTGLAITPICKPEPPATSRSAYAITAKRNDGTGSLATKCWHSDEELLLHGTFVGGHALSYNRKVSGKTWVRKCYASIEKGD